MNTKSRSFALVLVAALACAACASVDGGGSYAASDAGYVATSEGAPMREVLYPVNDDEGYPMPPVPPEATRVN